MPWGLVVLGAFTFLLFRRARRVGRNPYGWVLLLWAGSLGAGLLGSFVGYALTGLGADFVAIPATALGGMLAGLLVVTWASGRPVAGDAGPAAVAGPAHDVASPDS